MDKKTKTILLLIIILASFLRLWKITDYPAGLNADEAAIGYNAYSLLQTGKDEFGTSWPIQFTSFADYKPGGYFYLVLPFVKLFGLNEMAVRLPSALMGILAVFLLYFFVDKLLKSSTLALISSFLLAISPWHLHFSRGGWEVNVATALILLGAILFLEGLNKSKYLILSILPFIYSMYTYHSARVEAVLIGLGLILLYRNALIKKKREVFITGISGLVLLLPLLISFLSPGAMSRFSGVGFTAEEGPLWRVNELRGEHTNWNSLGSKIVHNKITGYSISFFQHYLDHYNGNFLFNYGDIIERSRVPETGQLYLLEFPLLLFGIWCFLKKAPSGWMFIFWWLMVAPIAAAATFQTPHALRAQNMVVPLVIIVAYGLWQLYLLLKNNHFRLLVIGYLLFIVLGYCWSFGRYLHQYYVHYPQTYPSAWEYGFKDLIQYLDPIARNYDKIYVTDKYDQPYILFLFYLQYPPIDFQKEAVLTPRDRYNFSTVKDFANYHFEGINWDSLKDEKNILIVGTDEEIPVDANIVKTINFTNGKPAFRVAKL